MPTNTDKIAKAGRKKLNVRIDALTVMYSHAEATLTSLVARMILGGTLGSPKGRRAVRSQVTAILSDLNARGVPEAERIVEQAYQLGVRLASQEITLTGSLGDQAVKLLQDNVKHRLGDATTHVGRRVDDVFRKEGLRQAAAALGDQEVPNASDQLQRRLVQQGVVAFTDTAGRSWGLAEYARMAVKTITSEAVFTATSTTLLANGLDIVNVNSVPDPCPKCQPYDGGTFSLSGRAPGVPILDTIFPIHPNCVLGDSEVLPVGGVKTASRAWYDGPVLTLETSSGVRLTVTPNHPLLTESGWVAAKEITEDQHLFDSGLGHRLSMNQEQEQRPTLAEDIFSAFMARGVHSRIAATANHFHGDGELLEGEIYVVLADRELLGEGDSELSEDRRELDLVGADVGSVALSRQSTQGNPLRGVLSSPSSKMSLFGLRSLTEFNPSMEQALAHGPGVNAVLLAETPEGASVEVLPHKVVNVHSEPFRGYVYDFETASGMYLCNGITIHNCGHYITISRDAFAERSAA